MYLLTKVEECGLIILLRIAMCKKKIVSQKWISVHKTKGLQYSGLGGSFGKPQDGYEKCCAAKHFLNHLWH